MIRNFAHTQAVTGRYCLKTGFLKIQRKTPVMTLFLVKSHTLARNFTKTDAIEGVFSSSRTVILYNVYDELLLGI